VRVTKKSCKHSFMRGDEFPFPYHCMYCGVWWDKEKHDPEFKIKKVRDHAKALLAKLPRCSCGELAEWEGKTVDGDRVWLCVEHVGIQDLPRPVPWRDEARELRDALKK